MIREQIGNYTRLASCATCGNTIFDVPDTKAFDPVIECPCGNAVGPYLSILAYANGEARTSVNARLLRRSVESRFN
jgi:hypothetical protein